MRLTDQSHLHLIHGLALIGIVASMHSGQYTDVDLRFRSMFRQRLHSEYAVLYIAP
jgi:hypothetical protein